MRILIVEDDDMIGESVVAGLESEDYAVDWVRDGNSALIALKTTPFSLVVLDLGLPGKDGLLHISQIANERVNQVSDYLQEGQTVRVKVIGFDDKNRPRLSMKALLNEE